jgi:hypothetical protein
MFLPSQSPHRFIGEMQLDGGGGKKKRGNMSGTNESCRGKVEHY